MCFLLKVLWLCTCWNVIIWFDWNFKVQLFCFVKYFHIPSSVSSQGLHEQQWFHKNRACSWLNAYVACVNWDKQWCGWRQECFKSDCEFFSCSDFSGNRRLTTTWMTWRRGMTCVSCTPRVRIDQCLSQTPICRHSSSVPASKASMHPGLALIVILGITCFAMLEGGLLSPPPPPSPSPSLPLRVLARLSFLVVTASCVCCVCVHVRVCVCVCVYVCVYVCASVCARAGVHGALSKLFSQCISVNSPDRFSLLCLSVQSHRSSLASQWAVSASTLPPRSQVSSSTTRKWKDIAKRFVVFGKQTYTIEAAAGLENDCRCFTCVWKDINLWKTVSLR